MKVVKSRNLYSMGQVQVDLMLQVMPEKVYYKEYLIYDGLGMFGSIGGSLGLFVGFSLFDSLCFVLDFVLRMIKFT